MPDTMAPGSADERGAGQRRWLWLTLAVIIFDLSTKAMATAWLDYATPVPVIPYFNLTLLHNTGAAFSFLASAGGWQRWFFIVLAIAISAVLLTWLGRLKRHETWLAIALALVLGGAIGNVYDRIVHGYVVDFIHLYYGSYSWPAFNIADSAISIGAVMMVIDVFRGGSAAEPDQAEERHT
ncbi:signal peptidase II [Allohahella sp. A8]|uniref:signal peptidase II n=1 Tax=Allohahella sp. A8 TaxID=3141461 RepID=UPI000C0AEA14|nr:signal peptidase II [Hahellaceae bacterium]|tara:strand:- start:15566 stop:16108 length:543 start_codon:yes stop_codon:yes gene_type:complete